ncbi:hypothetical protein, unlikely [Trypanosoma brucei brucei TREU927]|uniref:Uncharacterized protein n=1 Tax=Trypanosoma brucei brucei (strain 927/4 GUTat10.1) TaxID=185431 RepID=Q38EN0_TRYB2|nr:hypothetical protein, unlikely [Trypanosoma brucei brucei TREU927]EAN76740.1 hypothetical protein, unlikely [Trypanosoma brucei brucei TREU927]
MFPLQQLLALLPLYFRLVTIFKILRVIESRTSFLFFIALFFNCLTSIQELPLRCGWCVRGWRTTRRPPLVAARRKVVILVLKKLLKRGEGERVEKVRMSGDVMCGFRLQMGGRKFNSSAFYIMVLGTLCVYLPSDGSLTWKAL